MFKITIVLLLISVKGSVTESLNYEVNFKNVKKLPRFWTNTGFCPPAPNNDSTTLAEFFLSEKSIQNLDYISALPNNGLQFVRIHWLMNLIKFIGTDNHHSFQYDFTNLDKVLDQLKRMRLYPVIEFMGNPSNRFFNQKHLSQAYLWNDLVYQMLSRYIQRYGIATIKNWKFETWNEPDLRQYNTLNYKFNDYVEYIRGVRDGLDNAGVRDNNHKLLLYGPAGLFKNNKTHHLCWGIIEKCNSNITSCPFDNLSYHRKGVGEAEDVMNDSLDLLLTHIYPKFPNLRTMKISNSEADPTTGWSKPLHMNSDVRYAVTLVNIVLLHWNAKYNNILPTLDAISHDNGFISYHPYEFYQRTLLALFQLNQTNPVEIQYIQKPVYAAIGMLSNFGTFAGGVKNHSETGTLSLWTVSHSQESLFLCGIITSKSKILEHELKPIDVNVVIDVSDYKYVQGEMYASLIEYLEGNVTDPVYLWKSFGKPSYPNAVERQIMRKSQGPHILINTEVHRNSSHLSIHLNAIIKRPWIISVRICSELSSPPSQMKNLRIRKVNDNEVLLFWKEKFTNSRCTKTYEIFFSPYYWKSKWIHITISKHVPFMSYHFAPDMTKNLTTRGQYKVRAVDVFDRKGKFSLIKSFN